MIDTCTVIDISGDYAIIRYDSTGAEGQVALALLPENLNVGDRLRREFFDYEKICAPGSPPRGGADKMKIPRQLHE